MDYDPALYKKTAADTSGPAQQLIAILRKHFNTVGIPLEKTVNKNGQIVPRVPLIVDLGCGPGNTALALSEAFPKADIIGLDIDSNMVNYANEFSTFTLDSNDNPMANKCQFYQQDISASWSKGWCDELKQMLAGKVDAIFSSYALCWMDDFTQLAQNVSHMLRSNGRSVLVGNLLYDGDIATKAESDEERQMIESVVRYPKEQQFVSDLMFAFRNARFGQFIVDYSEPLSIFPENYYRNNYANIPLKWYKKFVDWSQLKQLGYNETHLDKVIKKLICADRINRVILPTWPSTQRMQFSSSGSSLSSSSFSSSDEDSETQPENQVEIRDQLWTFTIIKL